MKTRPTSGMAVAALLVAAASVCLVVGLRMVTVAGARSEEALTFPTDLALLALGGGVAVFLLGTGALLAARRQAQRNTGRTAESAAAPDLIDIREWSRELVEIRDDLRLDLAGGDEISTAPASIEQTEFTVPAGWRPAAQYILGPNGAPTDPLADLKQTRDQLMDAAERVDSIVQSIAEAMPSDTAPACCETSAGFWHRLRQRLIRR